MRVLVDTSVWSLALRRGGPAEHPVVEQLSGFLDAGEDLFLTGVILQEILQAFRSEEAVSRVVEGLESFPLLPVERATCLAAARIYRRCREEALGASTIDCHIAASAIDNDCQLLTTGRDFERMASICPLELT